MCSGNKVYLLVIQVSDINFGDRNTSKNRFSKISCQVMLPMVDMVTSLRLTLFTTIINNVNPDFSSLKGKSLIECTEMESLTLKT